MDPTDALNTGLVDLIDTATTFGQGAVASAISGNPFYSQDPAAANYATQTGVVSTSSSNGLGIIVLAVIAYLLLKK